MNQLALPTSRRIWPIPFVLIALGGCDRDPIALEPVDAGFSPRNSIAIPVLGHGTITGRYAAEVAVAGTWVYTTTWGRRTEPGNALMIWNAAGNTPALVDTVIVPDAGTLGDVQISDDGRLLVVAVEPRPNGALLIFDRSVPDRPVLLTRYSSPATQNGVHTVKLARASGRHYAFLSIDPSPAQLVILDITDPARPVEVLVRVMGLPFVHDVFVRDGILFTALWDDGLGIWDIGGGARGGTPANPVLISKVATVNGNVHNVWWYHDAAGQKRFVFIGEEGAGAVGGVTSGDVHVVDISDMASPREVAFYNVPGAGAHNFTMDEQAGILYAAFYNGGVRALDVRGNPGECAKEAKALDGRCNMGLAGREAGRALSGGSPAVSVWGVALSGSALYASDMLSGVFKLDVSSLR